MKTTIRQLCSYLLVAVMAGLMVGCTPEEMKVGLEANSKFLMLGDQYVGIGMVPGSDSRQFIIGQMAIKDGAYVVRGGLGNAKQALTTLQQAYLDGYKAISFWELPDDFKAWLVGNLMNIDAMPFSYLRLGIPGFFIVPVSPSLAPYEGCYQDATGIYCNSKGL